MPDDESKNKVDVSTEVRARIEQALHVRRAPRGTLGARLEHVGKAWGGRLWGQLKKRPSLGVAVTGTTALVLASLVGVGELTIAIVVGYGAYQVLREGVAPATAARNVVERLEKLG